MYLAAVKSLYRRIGHGAFLILDDGSLTASDKAMLQEHLGEPEILSSRSINTGEAIQDLMWERLIAVAERAQDNYVIQLDSDTLTTGPVPEVIKCIEGNRSFTLGTRMGQRFTTLAAAAAAVADRSPKHVQIAGEQALAKLPNAHTEFYVRGSAGFAGFAHGGFSRARVEEFCALMLHLVGDKWREWGADQVGSNYFVANSPQPVVLPHPKYASFDLDMDPRSAVFLHFIGTNRFDRGVYATLTNRVMRHQGELQPTQ